MATKVLIFLGSVREENTAPLPSRLGGRVSKACIAYLEQSDHNVELIDPLNYELGDTFRPYFSYRSGEQPAELKTLAEKITDADAYVMVSPEYNHTMSPALADLLNHFGSSLFSYKPSVIVTYSAGQWGGARAAVNMRTFLSELGCLPVSAMVHVPRAHNVFDSQGGYLDDVDAKDWSSYLGRAFEQMHWWAQAAINQRKISSPTTAFNRDPSQRNAP
ncbi:MAG: NADPH-dependent FMN reductase [Hyphomicrobiales bacterium]